MNVTQPPLKCRIAVAQLIGPLAIRRVNRILIRHACKGLVLPLTQTDTQITRDFAIAAARMAADTRCTDVVLLDVSRVSPVTDYLIIGTGTSARQMRSVCDDVEDMAHPLGFKALTRAGQEGETWMLVDFVTVVVHIFSGESRSYYDLENLWGDGERIEWKR